ncbi:site-specific integrase [Bradyrhizobium sp. Ec3.3]|uniref:site-specific integrase n=1 Tax=Bradyrhizobium sp. Ec3.3 TaxID=189753 RepID=UPI0018DDB95F|nr:site-specific integrase [Bradyrhizobium sp. Ec3.3]
MSQTTKPVSGDLITFGHVLERLAADPALSPTRRRDLRSAITTYAKLTDRAPNSITLDFGEIRETFDRIVPAAAKVSRKRWANLRSDLLTAIGASGLRPILRTSKLPLDPAWTDLYSRITRPKARNGLSRFVRWATLRRIFPEAVDGHTIEQFVADLDRYTLIRDFRWQHRSLVSIWNSLADLQPDLKLKRVVLPPTKKTPKWVRWDALPPQFQADVGRYFEWCAVTDPLDATSRKRALAPLTRELRRNHIRSAATDAIAAGIDVATLTSLALLVEVPTVTALVRHRWQVDGRKLSLYASNALVTLITIASEWVKAPPDQIAALKTLLSKVATAQIGMTEKNSALLRKFDDPRLLLKLVELPDRLWRNAQRNSARSPRRAFVDLQTALAIDLLLHMPVRIENLWSLDFRKHFHWPQHPRKSVCVAFSSNETKNLQAQDFEIPKSLADRLLLFRNEIAPTFTGSRPDRLFIQPNGAPRAKSRVAASIKKATREYLGVVCTPHQFRHLAAKITLKANRGALEQVRQLLGHKNPQTTSRFYAGIDTLAAGRAHADLIMQLREPKAAQRRRAPKRGNANA